MKELIREVAKKHAILNAYRHGGKAVASAVIGKVIAELPDAKRDMKLLVSVVKEVVEEVNLMGLEAQRAYLELHHPELLEKRKITEEKGLPPLPQAEAGKVVTRFPPEPNGHLHIGHAKAAIINQEYAKMYEGRLILRFDDTNPAKERLEYYEAIREELEWLGVKPDLVKNTSDDIETLYEYAERLIRLGLAYVCTCRVEEIRRGRALGLECPCRKRSVEENLSLWDGMLKDFGENEAVLRLKGDMKAKNTVLRDPTLFRIVLKPHPLKGTAYRAWPTYDFSAPIEDSLDGVTHAMRSKEYELRDELYYMILDALGMRKPILVEFSRLALRGTPLSKRRIKPLIESGKVSGWDDPRLATILALRRRGITPEAIRRFVIEMGVSKVESEPTWDLLYSLNRKLIDPKSKRLHFVPDPIRMKIENAEERVVRLRCHPSVDLGFRELRVKDEVYIAKGDAERLKVGDRLRLIGLYNVRIEEVGDEISASYAGESPIDLPKIQWVGEDRVRFRVLIPKELFRDGEFNEDSLEVSDGFAESAVEGLEIGEVFQFVRFGFCRLDSKGVAIFAHK